ncbi:heavy metal-associated isoprenylated plant protein 16 [Neltuma alba]|uniref:heavy metal-associated isoprenylated plant protein 16 n=1 Tax=Neltuma alba TaxID=207710 RepID=UPI0010A52BBA|nr:heavy metal-associated isoprenylated plant protein 16 [Prosopis alba]
MQVIAIEMEMCCAKGRRKALQLAAAAQGVVSVEMGEDQVIMVRGDEVDAVCLTNSLRKKFRYAKLLSVEHVNPPADDNTGKGGDGGDGGDESPGNEEENGKDGASPSGCGCNCRQFPPPPPPIPTYCYVLCDADPYPTICSIM